MIELSKPTPLSGSRLWELLPPNLQPDASVKAVCYALDRAFWQLVKSMGRLVVLADLENQPERIYDALALDLKVIGYRTNMPLSQKRALVLEARAAQMDKGTAGRVEKLMNEVFGDAELEEWFQYDGNPFMFRIVSSNPDLQDADAEYFQSVLEQVKNLRSHLEEIITRISFDNDLYFGSALHVGYYDLIE